eukprot:408480-Prorocentrum_lima.AAC.1
MCDRPAAAGQWGLCECAPRPRLRRWCGRSAAEIPRWTGAPCGGRAAGRWRRGSALPRCAGRW